MGKTLYPTVKLCACGCGEPCEKRYRSPDKRFKYWTRIAPTCPFRYRRGRHLRMGGKDNPSYLPIGTRRMYAPSTRPWRYWRVKVADPDVWKLEHRYVMEQHIGRPLQTKEHVHHLNHNTLDNRIENLELLSASDHAKIHSAKRPPPPGRKLKPGQWARHYDKCIVCNTTERRHAARGMCVNCYMRKR
jgi:hypothetical protein